MFGKREIQDKDGWALFNLNTKVREYEDYNTKNRGFYLTIRSTTRDKLYIDDIKVGHATQTELSRDGKKIYEGKLSEFEDKSATDKEGPNIVTDYSVKVDSSKQTLMVKEPSDNGTSYEYQIKAISNDGSGTYTSDKEIVEVTSGIAGYSYVIDKNKSTNPNGNINSEDGIIELDKDVYKDHYLHIQALDKAGNKSEVNHIKLEKVEDVTPPTINLEQTPTDWTNDKVTINVDAKDEQSGIKNIKYIGEDVVENGDFGEGKVNWNEYGYGKVEVKNGNLLLNDESKNTNRTHQVINQDLKTTDKYIEVVARGEGKLNARYGVVTNSGSCQTSFDRGITLESEKKFRLYVFSSQSFECLDSTIVLERIGSGWLEVENIKAYGTEDITDTRILMVTENGLYKFTVEDNVGNITTEDIEITNIDKIKPTIKATTGSSTYFENDDVDFEFTVQDKQSGLNSVEYKWNDESIVIKDFTGETDTQSFNAKIPKEVGVHKLEIAAEDRAGNVENKTYKVTREGSLSLTTNEINFEPLTLSGNKKDETSGRTTVKVKDTRINPDWKLNVDVESFDEKFLDIILTGDDTIESGAKEAELVYDFEVTATDKALLGDYTTNATFTLSSGP